MQSLQIIDILIFVKIIIDMGLVDKFQDEIPGRGGHFVG